MRGVFFYFISLLYKGGSTIATKKKKKKKVRTLLRWGRVDQSFFSFDCVFED